MSLNDVSSVYHIYATAFRFDVDVGPFFIRRLTGYRVSRRLFRAEMTSMHGEYRRSPILMQTKYIMDTISPRPEHREPLRVEALDDEQYMTIKEEVYRLFEEQFGDVIARTVLLSQPEIEAEPETELQPELELQPETEVQLELELNLPIQY
jgi:hypothetical protein